MWEKIKYHLLFSFKKIEITYRTWKNAVEIARAYSRPSRLNFFPVFSLPKRIRRPLLTAVGLCVFFLCALFIMRHTLTISRSHLSVSRPVSTPIPQHPDSLQKTVDNAGLSDTPDTGAEISPDMLDHPAVRPEVRLYPLHETTDSSSFFVIVANKAVKSLYLLQKQLGTWRAVRDYEIAVGEQDGMKKVAGDKRTPEGYYHIVGRKEKSQLSAIYGPLAFVLNYPNPEDRLAGRTGTGIWIHGTDPDSLPLETRGCIEMNNSMLLELGSILGMGLGTPVLIVNDSALTKPASAPDYTFCAARRAEILDEHRLHRDYFTTLVTEWKNAWQKKDIDTYATFYDTAQFKGQQLDWQQWKERKLRTFNLYDTIAITVENITVTDFTENETTVKFLQHYITNLNHIDNGKKLTFIKVSDSWKIIFESTCPTEEILI